MKNEQKFNFIKSLLSGWGMSESWAKLIAGAIIGALCACGFLSSCSPLNVEQANVAHAIIEVMMMDK